MTGKITREKLMLARLQTIFELTSLPGDQMSQFTQDLLYVSSAEAIRVGEVAGHKMNNYDDAMMLASRLKAVEQALLSFFRPDAAGSKQQAP
jgi:hypothetical protein